ncbi:hypothetical protein NMY22_g6949 [Coprinellus aureogranulatus]|nr:hypothetical protein NMY22_g6949 [Coprinellus aureogranulatus]
MVQLRRSFFLCYDMSKDQRKAPLAKEPLASVSETLFVKPSEESLFQDIPTDIKKPSAIVVMYGISDLDTPLRPYIQWIILGIAAVYSKREEGSMHIGAIELAANREAEKYGCWMLDVRTECTYRSFETLRFNRLITITSTAGCPALGYESRIGLTVLGRHVWDELAKCEAHNMRFILPSVPSSYPSTPVVLQQTFMLHTMVLQRFYDIVELESLPPILELQHDLRQQEKTLSASLQQCVNDPNPKVHILHGHSRSFSLITSKRPVDEIEEDVTRVSKLMEEQKAEVKKQMQKLQRTMSDVSAHWEILERWADERASTLSIRSVQEDFFDDMNLYPGLE